MESVNLLPPFPSLPFIRLNELNSTFFIGHTTALSLYEQGYRSIRDLRAAKLYSTQLEYYEDSQEKSVETFFILYLERV